ATYVYWANGGGGERRGIKGEAPAPGGPGVFAGKKPPFPGGKPFCVAGRNPGGGDGFWITTETENYQRRPGGANPVRPRWATSRKRVLRGRKAAHGQPWPRSVDSERAGRVIEPRN